MESITSLLWSPTKSNDTSFQQKEEIKFFIHDVEHTVKASDTPLDMSLNEYIRTKAQLTGTKNMCLEGGCGSCVVAVSFTDPVTKRTRILSVNSCLAPLYKMAGKKIYVIERIGNEKTGYHPIQKAMVQFSGTQCGFCTPGMLMNMYALHETGDFTMQDVENAFDGNICRCTGYRPILTAFKSLASDASAELIGSYCDIEDMPVCLVDRTKCREQCAKPLTIQNHFLQNGKQKWYRATTINEIFDVIKTAEKNERTPYMLLAGNTASGVYPRPKNIEIFIDVSQVAHLQGHSISDDKLIIGGNTTLADAISLFMKMAKEHRMFSYLQKIAEHIASVANVPVRNVGTIGGSLMLKHEHPEFPSDIFLTLETVGATLVLEEAGNKTKSVSLLDFRSLDMYGYIIKSIVIPSFSDKYFYESYKITPRAQNAHALQNAGFLFKLTTDTDQVQVARIVYGHVNPDFVHAKKSEEYLINKNLFDNDTLQGVFKLLVEELTPDYVLPDSTPKFRKELAIALFYKFVLSIAPENKLQPKNKSGGMKLKLNRPISNGTQDYQTKESLYPVTKPIPKLEALAQSTGDAEYIMDKPDGHNQLFAAFVLAKAPANSVIAKTDIVNALALPGVVDYFDKTHIPGENNFMPKAAQIINTSVEEVFCSGTVKYYFQPVGLIVATSQKIAEEAADLVEISYTEGKEKPLLTIRDILANNATNKIFPEGKKLATRREKRADSICSHTLGISCLSAIAQEIKLETSGTDFSAIYCLLNPPQQSPNTITKMVLLWAHLLVHEGTFDISWQYHFHMENQCCIAIPTEDGIDLYPGTQDMNQVQVSTAKFLNIPVNRVNVMVRRLGGAYGAKISRNNQIACAAALAAYKLKKPIKFSLPLQTNMNVVGKRFPFSADYEVEVDDNGKIQSLVTSGYSDLGCSGGNEDVSITSILDFAANYNAETWTVYSFSTRTDNHTGTYCRAPGTTESIAWVESIMEHIAEELKLDPLEVRYQNGLKPMVVKYTKDLVEWADVKQRQRAAEEFNKTNRWIKKGIAIAPMLYSFIPIGNWYAFVSIFQGDGSVSITHGGIEMGQGINTKAAQVCAYSLGIPLDQVSVKPAQASISPNNIYTGGSGTSESVCAAVIEACKILNARMLPFRLKLPLATWPELVQACHLGQVDLAASYMHALPLINDKSYPIFGATCVEVEVDILTGLNQILRVDLIEDVGESMSPLVDIGQVEGAFVMGLGYWTSEQIVFDDKGQLLTNRTWNYKPPGAKDIPIDFRVKFPKNNPNPLGIFYSKATAEPPLCMSVGVALAIRNAVGSARQDSDPKSSRWYSINGPSTVENTFLNSLNDHKQYKL